jgi:hypothetical protein
MSSTFFGIHLDVRFSMSGLLKLRKNVNAGAHKSDWEPLTISRGFLFAKKLYVAKLSVRGSFRRCMKKVSIGQLIQLFKSAEPFDEMDLEILLNEYFEDPSHLICPNCGDWDCDTSNKVSVEVITFVDTLDYTKSKSIRKKDPEDEYSALVYCHECGKGAALHLDDSEAED